nr:MAG TPA: hypothetical protein [Caudoviricetes sp.]
MTGSSWFVTRKRLSLYSIGLWSNIAASPVEAPAIQLLHIGPPAIFLQS